jgi:TPR repeat protein
MCTEIVFVSALALTMIWPAFTPSQSPSSAVVPNSRASQIDLKKLTKKANSGDTAAQFKFGYAYHFGVGVDKNVYQAIEWYRKAANYGDPAAQTNLGYIYETGPEAAKDLHEAVKWYTRAAVSGNPEGAFNLGLAYLYGTGVNQSIDDARQWIGAAQQTRAVPRVWPRSHTCTLSAKACLRILSKHRS